LAGLPAGTKAKDRTAVIGETFEVEDLAAARGNPMEQIGFCGPRMAI